MIRRISGNSMSPAIETGQYVFITKFGIKKGSIVLAKIEGREVVKRVKSIERYTYYLVGDNSFESTDSRHYGPVDKSAIIGNVMFVFPKATKPPKVVKSYGLILGRIAAGLLVVVALVHLFRIDTLVPILNTLLPGGHYVAGTVTVGIIFSEIFAIPFALRMKLSPLMHMFSGLLMLVAPVSWFWLTIWAYGTNLQVGLLGEFVPVYATALLLLVNFCWVAFNYTTLYTLGFNTLSSRSLLRK